MSDQLFEEWVEKAEEDYRAATALDVSDVPAVVCFLSQQCIEKYLKAALARHGAAVPRTHNLIVLNDMVCERDRRFEELSDALDVLNPHSVAVRYPGMEVTPEDARQGLKAASISRAKLRILLGLEVEK